MNYIFVIMNIKTVENMKIFEMYFSWKQLNNLIREDYTRGVNLHEAISENLCCIINGYILHAAIGGSEDAITPNGLKVQIKATSNFNSDLSSFGPTSEFDILEFLRLDAQNDIFYCYRIPIKELESIKVNENTSFIEMQHLGRRPRFSIINKIIIPKNYKPYAIINMRNGEVVFNR